jgi:hypothetical protein
VLDGVMIDATVTVSRLPERVGDPPLTVEELRHNKGNAATYGIWRVRGSAGSAVLKISSPPPDEVTGFWPTSDRPNHWNYWQREALAYTSGLAATAFPTIAPPSLLESHRRSDGLIELWLDDVAGAEGFAWPVPRIARFAYELGAGQASWAGRVPAEPWLSRRWLAQYLAEGPSRSVDIRDADWDHPTVAAWPEPVRRDLRRLWHERDRVLALAEAADRTLCHLDVWPANLIDANGTSTLLDWAFAGEGAIGEDLSNLIVDSFTDGLMDAALLPELADAATESYLRGLHDGGWSGSPDAVRVATAACGAAKYSWFAPALVGRAVRDERRPTNYSRDSSAESAVQRVTGLVEFISGWAADATAGSR